jgi:hypothetical protein
MEASLTDETRAYYTGEMSPARVVCLMLALAASAGAQTVPEPRFEVASVKPHVPGTSTTRGGMCSGTNSTTTVTSMSSSGSGAPVGTRAVSMPPGMCTFRQTVLREFSPLAALAPELRQRFTNPADPSGPSLFTALQEQLGLRLQATKVSLDVLVIDAVQRPTPN